MTTGRRVDFPVPPNAHQVWCASCHLPVWWIVTEKGRRMPLDVGSAIVVEGETRAESHFAHCPHAANWRGK